MSSNDCPMLGHNDDEAAGLTAEQLRDRALDCRRFARGLSAERELGAQILDLRAEVLVLRKCIRILWGHLHPSPMPFGEVDDPDDDWAVKGGKS